MTGGDVLRDALSGERRHVQCRFSLEYHAVERNTLAGLDEDHTADGHLLRIDFCDLTVDFQIRIFRPNIHQRGDASAALAHGVALEKFTDLIEQHDRDALRILAQDHGADRRNGHQQALVERLTVQDALDGLAQHIISRDEVGDQIQRKPD